MQSFLHINIQLSFCETPILCSARNYLVNILYYFVILQYYLHPRYKKTLHTNIDEYFKVVNITFMNILCVPLLIRTTADNLWTLFHIKYLSACYLLLVVVLVHQPFWCAFCANLIAVF